MYEAKKFRSHYEFIVHSEVLSVLLLKISYHKENNLQRQENFKYKKRIIPRTWAVSVLQD